MTMLKARCALVVLAALLLLSTLAEAKAPQLPPPDPERGSIGVTIRAIPPGKFGKMAAVQVYFVRPAEGGDVLDAEFVISSNYSDKKQVYSLNAKPGCYVAVAARLKGGGVGFLYEAFFSMEMLPEMEVMVVPGKLVFMGDFLLNTSTKMREADSVQSHFYRLMLPEAASQGFMGRTFSGKAPYTATFKSVDKGAETEREFWSLAEQKVFKKEPAWQKFVQMRLETSAKSCAAQNEGVVPPLFDEPSIEAASDDAEILEAVDAAVTVAKNQGFQYDTSDSENGRVVVTALWKGRPVTLTMRFFQKESGLYIASAMEQPGDVYLAGGGQKIEQIFYPDLLQETTRRGLTVHGDPEAQP